MRLIDADELIEHVWRDRVDSRERIANLVESMPAVKETEGVWQEVIRCRDCKHLGVTRTGMLWCMHDCGIATPELDDFCSYGERKE